jgi:hypothetical protein
MVLAECAESPAIRDVALSLSMNEDLSQWTPSPSSEVLNVVNSLNISCIINTHCCNSKCLTSIDASVVRACHIRYLSMSQAASWQWLRIIMENQPISSRRYYIYHNVRFRQCPIMWILNLPLTYVITAGLLSHIHGGTRNFRKQDGKLLQCRHSVNWTECNRCSSSSQCVVNKLHQLGMLLLFFLFITSAFT